MITTRQQGVALNAATLPDAPTAPPRKTPEVPPTRREPSPGPKTPGFTPPTREPEPQPAFVPIPTPDREEERPRPGC